jgi:hypothetical protein
MAKKLSPKEEIEHYLRLASDPGATQAERDLASARAEKLMMKHSIERAMLDPDGQSADEIVKRDVRIYGTKSSYSLNKVLGFQLVVKAMGLQVLVTDRRDPKNNWTGDKGHMEMHIIGFSSDLDEAEMMVRSLDVQVMVALRAWSKSDEFKTGAGLLAREDMYRAKHEFVKYFGAGAAHRIMEEREAAIAESGPGTGLVLVTRAEKVRAAADKMTGGTTNHKSRQSGLGRGAGWAAGQEAGAGRKAGLGAAVKAIGR